MRQKLARPAIESVSAEFGNGADVKTSNRCNLVTCFMVRRFGCLGATGPADCLGHASGKVQGRTMETNGRVESPRSKTKATARSSGCGRNSVFNDCWPRNERAQGSERDEIVRLCEAYSIVSPYASMLVLENDDEYKRWKIEQRKGRVSSETANHGRRFSRNSPN